MWDRNYQNKQWDQKRAKMGQWDQILTLLHFVRKRKYCNNKYIIYIYISAARRSPHYQWN
jgi:hypothetical protein